MHLHTPTFTLLPACRRDWSDMAHRSRSRTAESADAKKSKGTPRRLTEKIAIMKRREHEQSEAFEKAMKSIFEVYTCTLHRKTQLTDECMCVGGNWGRGMGGE